MTSKFLNHFIEKIVGAASLAYFPALLLIDNPGKLIALVLLFSIFGLLAKQTLPKISKEERYYILSLLLFPLYVLLCLYMFEGNIRDFDNYSRFLLVIPIFFFVREYSISFNWFLIGILVAAFLYGAQTISSNYFEINLFEFKKHLGMISLYGSIFGMICLYSTNPNRNFFTNLILYLGGISGIMVSLIGGGRGVWIALIITAAFMFFYNPLKMKKIQKMFMPLTILALFFLSYFLPSTNVANRVNLINTATIEYINNGKESDINKGVSLISRFEMIKSSIKIIKNNPWFGVGENNFKKHNESLISNGESATFIKKYNHPHSQVLSTMVQQGFFGFILLVFILYSPLGNAIYRLKNHTSHDFSYRLVISALLIISFHFIFYGLFNAIFAHQNMVLFYAFTTSYLMGILFRKQS